MEYTLAKFGNDLEYVSPYIQMYEMQSEGILCESPGTEVVDENMGSAWDD